MSRKYTDRRETANQPTIQSRATIIIGSAGAILALFRDLINEADISYTKWVAIIAVSFLLVSMLLGISTIYFNTTKIDNEDLLGSSLLFLCGGLITTAVAIVSKLFKDELVAITIATVFGLLVTFFYLCIIKKNQSAQKQKNDYHKPSKS